MADLASFLAWFDGFAENIKKQPSPEQWQRIKDRVGELNAEQIDSRPAPQQRREPVSQPVQAQPKPKKPANAAEWRRQFKDAMVELGLDPESADDFAASAEPDLQKDPAVVAKSAVAGMLN